MSIDIHSGKIWPILDSDDKGAFGIHAETLEKLLAFVDAWDDCQTVTANQTEKMCVLLSARKALDEL